MRIFLLLAGAWALLACAGPQQGVAPPAIVATVDGSSSGPAQPDTEPPLEPHAQKRASCREQPTVQQAEEDLRQAEAWIDKAGEHPSSKDLDEILPRLKRAALAGNTKAQRRYGGYVVGYWIADEAFWPRDKETAVMALAMLRIAVRRGEKPEGFGGLASDPVDRSREPLSWLPVKWIDLAVKAADEWERCYLQRGGDGRS